MKNCSGSLQVGVIDAKLEVQILECDEITNRDIPVDISSASTKTITIRRPDTSLITKTGIFSTDGTDGKMYFLTESNDITLEGTYKIQGHIVLTAWNGRSTIGEFEVHDNLV